MSILRIVFVGALTVAPALAFVHHDIPWYASHPTERMQVEKTCQKDTKLSERRMRSDCANARRAAAGQRAKGLNETLNQLDRLVALERMRRGF